MSQSGALLIDPLPDSELVSSPASGDSSAHRTAIQRKLSRSRSTQSVRSGRHASSATANAALDSARLVDAMVASDAGGEDAGEQPLSPIRAPESIIAAARQAKEVESRQADMERVRRCARASPCLVQPNTRPVL